MYISLFFAVLFGISTTLFLFTNSVDPLGKLILIGIGIASTIGMWHRFKHFRAVHEEKMRLKAQQ